MATLSNLKAGQTLYFRYTYKCGNVIGGIRKTGIDTVIIKEVFSDYAITDTGKKLYPDDIKKLLVKKPK